MGFCVRFSSLALTQSRQTKEEVFSHLTTKLLLTLSLSLGYIYICIRIYTHKHTIHDRDIPSMEAHFISSLHFFHSPFFFRSFVLFFFFPFIFLFLCLSRSLSLSLFFSSFLHYLLASPADIVISKLAEQRSFHQSERVWRAMRRSKSQLVILLQQCTSNIE